MSDEEPDPDLGGEEEEEEEEEEVVIDDDGASTCLCTKCFAVWHVLN